MNRPRRFESKKAPERLQALDKNDSGDSADDDRGNSLTIMTMITQRTQRTCTNYGIFQSFRSTGTSSIPLCGQGWARGRVRRGSRCGIPKQEAVTETAWDGTVWNICSPGFEERGRMQKQNVLKEAARPTQFATQHIRKDSIVECSSTFDWSTMMCHANSTLHGNWS